MIKRNCAAVAALSLLLGGCLEVDQHPAYADGKYAGKRDNRAADASFKGDNSAWKTAIAARTKNQNEYNRANP